jgi:hypothetical protein
MGTWKGKESQKKHEKEFRAKKKSQRADISGARTQAGARAVNEATLLVFKRIHSY